MSKLFSNKMVWAAYLFVINNIHRDTEWSIELDESEEEEENISNRHQGDDDSNDSAKQLRPLIKNNQLEEIDF